MAMADRAAQFAPFAALTGYEDAVSATAAETVQAVALQDRPMSLPAQLRYLEAALAQGQQPEVTVFIACAEPSDVPQRQLSGTVRQLDPASRVLVFHDGTVLSLDCILSLDGALFRP
jgi:hypothetical protein